MARHTGRGITKTVAWTAVPFAWLTRYDTGAKVRYDADQFAAAQADAAALAATIPGHTVEVRCGAEIVRFFVEDHTETLADVDAYLAA